MEIISIIPARGGSKGIPKKNIKIFAGKPLLAHTIEHSIYSKLVNRTFVSTDSKDIMEVSKKFGAEVIPRPAEIADDISTSESAIVHALSYLKENENYVPDIVVFLQCTSPLRKKDDIDNQIKKLLDNNLDSVFSATENNHFIWKIKEGKPLAFNYDYKNRPRRQDRDKELVENGSIYVLRTEKFLKEHNRNCGKIGYYEMPYQYSFEIDEKFDFWLCEKIFEKLNS